MKLKQIRRETVETINQLQCGKAIAQITGTAQDIDFGLMVSQSRFNFQHNKPSVCSRR